MSEFIIEPASRMKRLPPYLFGRLNALKLEKRRQDIDIIDLGMGNPMDGAPDLVIEKMPPIIDRLRKMSPFWNQPAGVCRTTV